MTELHKIKDELCVIAERIRQQDELFNLTDDWDLIEAVIYEQLSLRARYSYLIRKAREKCS